MLSKEVDENEKKKSTSKIYMIIEKWISPCDRCCTIKVYLINVKRVCGMDALGATKADRFRELWRRTLGTFGDLSLHHVSDSEPTTGSTVGLNISRGILLILHLASR